MPTSSVGVCHMTWWLFCPFLLSLLTLLSILPIKSAHHCHKEYPVSLFFIFLLSMPLSFRVMPRNCFIILQRQVLFLKELQGHLLKSLPPRVLGSWGEDSSKQWKQQIKLHRTHSLGTTRRQTTWHTASHLYVEKQAPNSSKVNLWNPSAITHAEQRSLKKCTRRGRKDWDKNPLEKESWPTCENCEKRILITMKVMNSVEMLNSVSRTQ